MAHYTLSNLKHGKSLPNHVDVVVVGAGMSGLYSTWRLLQENPNLNIVVLDRSNRTGGRLDSDLVHFKGGETVKEEEGGMRFTFDGMDDLMSLFLLLDIDKDIVPFPMNSGGNNRLYFRGTAFTNQDAANSDFLVWSELYDLESSEQGVNPKNIINTVFNRILDVNPDFKERPEVRSPSFWQKFRLECQWNGTALNDWTLWDLFSSMGYSNECVTLLYRLLGFNGTFLSQMNAGVAYQLLEDFPSEPDFKTLENGFSTLPNALVDKVGMDHIFLKTDVTGLDSSDNGNSYNVNYTSVDNSGNPISGTLKANKVILGLPRLALEKLFIRSNAFNTLPRETSETIWNTLQTTTNQALLKINLYYDKAWWGNSISGQPPVAFGPNFSDLPTGSVYPFYAIDKESIAALEYETWLKDNGKDVPADLKEKLDAIDQKKYSLPAALTIYCDFLNINFWKGMQNVGPKFTSDMQEQFNNDNPQTVYPASQAVVNEATKFFKKIFNTHYVPEPTLTSARIWDGSTRFDDPASEQFGYGVHQWALGADDKAVMALLTEPLPNVFTCGEAFSDYQGWVEGALRSSDLVLEKGFNLKPISEVYEEQQGVSSSNAIKAKYAQNSAAMIREYIDPHFEPTADTQPPCRSTPIQKEFSVDLEYFDMPLRSIAKQSPKK